MPIFVFRCPKCENEQERLYTTAPSVSEGPICHICRVLMRRVPTAGSFVLKGAGFYKPSPEKGS